MEKQIGRIRELAGKIIKQTNLIHFGKDRTETGESRLDIVKLAAVEIDEIAKRINIESEPKEFVFMYVRNDSISMTIKSSSFSNAVESLRKSVENVDDWFCLNYKLNVIK